MPQLLTDEQEQQQFLAAKNMAVPLTLLTCLIWHLVISSCL
jgi:hypothetical protein